MSNRITRRGFLKATAAVAGTSSLSASALADNETKSLPSINRLLSSASLPAKKGTRIVILGGGWSGLTIAKYLKKYRPDFDVVLIDKREQFVSWPLSNLWLHDEVNLEYLSHSYVEAASLHDYLYLNADAIDLDRQAKSLYTSVGRVDYDYLVLAPGIDYDYEKIGIDNPEDEATLSMHYPAGFNNASEVLAIKHKLHNFQGDTLVLTVPTGNYRCMAAPYERACVAASIFRERNLKAKVLLLDMNPDVRIKAEGFKRAWEKFYGEIIQYEPSAMISGFNLADKEIETDFDTYGFDDAVVYPPIRASKIIEQFGLSDPESLQKEAAIDPFKYHLLDDEFVYVTGDSRSQPFSKSGNTAHSEGRYVAEVIIAHQEGREIDWRSPQTMCFSGVRFHPLEAMSIIAFYKYNEEDKEFAFDRVHLMDKWNGRAGQAGLAWAEGMYRDMFYS